MGELVTYYFLSLFSDLVGQAGEYPLGPDYQVHTDERAGPSTSWVRLGTTIWTHKRKSSDNMGLMMAKVGELSDHLRFHHGVKRTHIALGT